MDVKRVIKGLECYIGGFPGEENCKQCQYRPHRDGCKSGAIMDALALLKAQEPRVMTLEEVRQWCETHPHKQNPIWVEFQHGYGNDGWRVGLLNSGLLSWCKDKEARFWTSRPTDEQRKAVKWG